MFRALSKFSLITIITALMAGPWLLPLTALAAPEHLVINEVQTSGGPGATTNDFIELFNPTSQPFDLDGYRLVKRSATSSTDTTIKSWTSSTLVPAYGFYLWANSNYTTIAAAPDAATSQIISDNNGIALRQGAADSGIIIDSLAWGTATNGLGEGALPANPEANQSLTRQSTGAGSRQDTNDNNQDFGLTASPTPQNSSTTPEAAADGGGGGSGDSSGIPLNPGTPQPGEVVINEFVSDPTDGGNEWVELYNRTS
ncbi:MAG TPA: lamin tail domain-containing protein, partial [Patescibacteria group bacterium]|nr:lamin tail domain-containing protein [Patescibacteria group bacterium]